MCKVSLAHTTLTSNMKVSVAVVMLAVKTPSSNVLPLLMNHRLSIKQEAAMKYTESAFLGPDITKFASEI